MTISHVLIEFLFRLTFGIAAAMALAPAQWITAGFFRIHLWVLLGVQTLAVLALSSAQPPSDLPAWAAASPWWLALGAALVSYLGAVLWMYEARWLGKAAIVLVSGLALGGSLVPVLARGQGPVLLQAADRITGGLLLGLVTTSMLLGHWYLNTPTMRLAPLRRLLVALAGAVGLRAAVCLAGLVLAGGAAAAGPLATSGPFVALRWLAGIVGVAVLTGLTWQTLKIPNTQSATGILYAAVILAFIGELTSQLMSARSLYPL
jgi:hypothetical protein